MSAAELLQRLLEQIGQTAHEAAKYAGQLRLQNDFPSQLTDVHLCIPKSLPDAVKFQAVDVAINTRADNAPTQDLLSSWSDHNIIGQELYSLCTTRYWEPTRDILTVSFLGDPSARFKASVMQALNRWDSANRPKFVVTNDIGEVRISAEPIGNWSFCGTDINLVPKHQATTNFDVAAADIASDVFFRVVQHQAGHLLGFRHHPLPATLAQRLNKERTLEYLEKLMGWSHSISEQIVFGGVNMRDEDEALFSSSIMGWQFPSCLSIDGLPVDGTSDISHADIERINRVYGNDAMTQTIGNEGVQNPSPE